MKVLLLIVAIALILLSLLQSGKTEGLSAFTGSGDLGLFQNVKERGPEKVISQATLVAGVLFFVLVIAIRVFE